MKSSLAYLAASPALLRKFDYDLSGANKTKIVGTTAAVGRISMDGRGRFLDNILIERLWRAAAKAGVTPNTVSRYETVQMPLLVL